MGNCISRNTVVVTTLAKSLKSECRWFLLSLNLLRSCVEVKIFCRYQLPNAFLQSYNLHFWKASHVPCIGKLTAVSSLLPMKPSLPSTASTLSPERLDATFVYSGNIDVIILAPKLKKSRYSRMRIALKQTLTRIIQIIPIPDWSQTNAP